MKPKWKGMLVGGIVGGILAILFLINLGTSYCVKGFGLTNFFCSVSQTLSEFGIIAMIFSIPKLITINLFRVNGMDTIIVAPLLIFFGISIGVIISFLLNYSRKHEK